MDLKWSKPAGRVVKVKERLREEGRDWSRRAHGGMTSFPMPSPGRRAGQRRLISTDILCLL